jgi:hypothetical protein
MMQMNHHVLEQVNVVVVGVYAEADIGWGSLVVQCRQYARITV